MSKNIHKEVRQMLIQEANEMETVLSTIKSNIGKAKAGFKTFLKNVMSGEFKNVDAKDVAMSLKTSAAGAKLLKDVVFQARVGQAAENLGVSPTSLIKIMNKESKLNPRAVNPYTKATGLIQFMPKTAESLGTTVDELKNKSAIEQMDYVEQYFKPYKGKVKTYEDLYMVTFFPKALGKSDNTIIQTKKTSAEKISRQNPAIAKAAGKKPGEPLTVGDVKTFARK